MSETMTCNNFRKPDWQRAIEEIVDEVCCFFRNRGHKRDVAVEQTALALGLSNRRTWSLLYQQPVATCRDEYEAIRERFIVHLDEQARDLAARSEAARNRRRQLELELES